MKELKCPQCGSVFQVDEADYASILNQVKNEEFNAELERRVNEMRKQFLSEQKADNAIAENAFQQQLNEKDKAISERDNKIKELDLRLKSIEDLKASEMERELAKKDAEILRLEQGLKIAVLDEKQKAQSEITSKDTIIQKLQSEAELERSKAVVREQGIKEDYENKLKVAQEQIDYYKDLKSRMSTKMIGETLEQHCSIQYNQTLRSVMPLAYFEKDNDASGGTKGDFIFRDYGSDGTEYVSIMFEMKNEADTTSTKHKNEDFFKKLDEDRRKKGCEFAVLVSLLEPDNELYNGGIVDVSYKFDKMYVIRPQFFLPLITLLVQTSKKSLEYKQQLKIAQSKEVDVTNFEAKIEDFKTKFGRHYEQASKKFDTAIKDIDASIKKLQDVRAALVGSEGYLRMANQDTDDLTIRKLTYKNPTMKTKFEEARQLTSGD